MFELPDPLHLSRYAALTRAHAEAVRARAGNLLRMAEDSHWAGPASRAFRAEAHQAGTRLVAAGRHLDDAADGLQRYAAALRVEVAGIEHRRAAEQPAAHHWLDLIGGPR